MVLAESVAMECVDEVPMKAMWSRSSIASRPSALPSVMPLDMIRAAVRCATDSPSATMKITFLALAVSGVA